MIDTKKQWLTTFGAMLLLYLFSFALAFVVMGLLGCDDRPPSNTIITQTTERGGHGGGTANPSAPPVGFNFDFDFIHRGGGYHAPPRQFGPEPCNPPHESPHR